MPDKKPATDYKIIADMIKEMDSQYKTLQEFTMNAIETTYGLDSVILDAILPYTEEKINVMSIEDMKALLTKYGSEENTEKIIASKKEMDETLSDEDAARSIISFVRESSMNLISTKEEADKLKKESEDVLNEYFNYLSSPLAQEKRMKRLEAMKEAAENEADEVSKKKMLHMIESMEASHTLSFLFKRFDSLGKKEIESINDAFFNASRGSYVINKFKSKISNYGFNPDLYKYFFNLEENFLPEDYHVFNNLFLFIYMRFAAYSDANSKEEKMYVQSLTSCMGNLIYHKFPSTENEKNFIEVMKKILDNFKNDAGLYEYYEKNNTTQPKHPQRIEADKKHELMRKDALIKKMEEIGIDNYDPEASANDLQEFFNTEVEKLIEEQKNEKETSENVTVTESEDGSVTIEPNLKSEV